MPRTLLLADDSVVIQKLVGLSFANEDIEIITVDNGDDAVSRAQECKPDIVLADVVMPGLNGYEVCSALRGNAELSGVPVLLLTGTFEAFDESRAQEAGATGHITKPFEAQALVDRVNELLQAAAQAAPPAVAVESSEDFFDENVSELVGDVVAPPLVPTTTDALDDFAFGGSPSETPSTTPSTASTTPATTAPLAEASAETIALDIGSDSYPSVDPILDQGLDSLIDGAGGDRTVALMPDADVFATPPPIGDLSGGQTPNPDATMLVDDFMEPVASNPPLAPPVPDVAIGDPTPLASPTADRVAPPTPQPISQAIAAPVGDPSLAASGGVSDPSLELDDLSFGSAPTVPPSDLAATGDQTVLAGDLFDDEPDLSADKFSLAGPRDGSLPPSQGLDLDFGASSASAASAAVSAESIVPENTDDYDVSASDLRIDSSGWDNQAPAAAAPEPISLEAPQTTAPAPDFSPQPEAPAPPVPTPAPSLQPEALEVPAPILEAPRETGFTAAPEPVISAPETTTPETGASAATRPDLTPVMRERVHDTLEKVAWEAFADLSEDIVRQVLDRIEKIAWEVIPQMAETLVQEEIRRMKAEDE